jgi:8-oxo-dGTP pyrophosphatase MutT (NUDIX family)
MTASRGRVARVERCELAVTGRDWPFARENAEAIDAHWQRRTAECPGYFNGRIHMLSSYTLDDGIFDGRLTEVEFKQFLYWRDMGQPDAAVFDAFGSALIRSADDAVLLGRQRPGNINAGLAYLPGGFIDTRDVDAAGRVDIRASVLREVEEETGMATRDLAARDGFLVTFTGQQISIAVEILADAPARELVGRCGARIAADPGSELEDILAVRTRGDLEALAMPDYARLLLGEMLPVSRL